MNLGIHIGVLMVGFALLLIGIRGMCDKSLFLSILGCFMGTVGIITIAAGIMPWG
jgi:hypothetical protein